jgi:hypothetical protein
MQRKKISSYKKPNFTEKNNYQTVCEQYVKTYLNSKKTIHILKPVYSP